MTFKETVGRSYLKGLLKIQVNCKKIIVKLAASKALILKLWKVEALINSHLLA